jgi:alanine racemase
MHYPSVIELSKSALENNFSFLREYYGKDVRISSVVKANAYGHGIQQFVPVAESCGIDHFSVFSLDEAVQVRKVLKNHADVMVMGWIDPADVEAAVADEYEFFVFEPEVLTLALEASKKTGKKAKIHLEIETGMNRTGLTSLELKKSVKVLKQNPTHFIIRGLCTHYAGAESISNYFRIQKQYKSYHRTYKWLARQGIVPDIMHTACSAASVAYPKTRMDMVRVGILQYGFWPSPETFIYYTHGNHTNHNPLSHVISWKSSVMSIKPVKSGEFVSYGTTYLAKEDMTIAIIPTGYSTGYSRSLSNQGRVLIHGQRVGVVGMVNMNMLVIDITGMEGVEIGDEVVFIGVQGEQEITVASFVEFSDQLNYEILARLPQNIPRIVVD